MGCGSTFLSLSEPSTWAIWSVSMPCSWLTEDPPLFQRTTPTAPGWATRTTLRCGCAAPSSPRTCCTSAPTAGRLRRWRSRCWTTSSTARCRRCPTSRARASTGRSSWTRSPSMGSGVSGPAPVPAWLGVERAVEASGEPDWGPHEQCWRGHWARCSRILGFRVEHPLVRHWLMSHSEKDI